NPRDVPEAARGQEQSVGDGPVETAALEHVHRGMEVWGGHGRTPRSRGAGFVGKSVRSGEGEEDLVEGGFAQTHVLDADSEVVKSADHCGQQPRFLDHRESDDAALFVDVSSCGAETLKSAERGARVAV